MRHIINVLALALGVAAALSVCGCRFSGETTRNTPALADFIVSPKPQAFCEGATIVCPEGWKVCNGEDPATAEPMVTMPATTLERMTGARRAGADTNAAETAERGTYPRILKRTVTRYEEGIPGEPIVTETTEVPTESAGGCP